MEVFWLIPTLASNICFSYRNMFQNGVDALSKIVDAFLSKSSKFYLVWVIRKCSNFDSLWHKHLLRNYKWHFRLLMSAFATVIWKTLSKHQLFTLNFAFQLFHVSIAIDNCKSQKYHLYFLYNYVYHKLAKFDQNRMIWTIQIFSFFLQKAVSHVNHSDISLAPFWKRFEKWKWNNFTMLNGLKQDFHLSLFQKLR